MPSYKDEKTGKWYCSFYYTDLRGKRVRKLKRGFSLKREADKWERDFLAEEHTDDITIDTLIKEYIDNIDHLLTIGNIKLVSAKSKKYFIATYILPYFKNVLASRLQTKHINDWLDKLTYSRKKGDSQERLASSTVNKARSILNEIFEFGKINHRIKYNPVTDSDKLKFYTTDVRAKFWTVEQYNIFRATLENPRYIVFFDTLFYTGMRMEEINAISPEDVTPYKINVDKAYIYAGNEQYFDVPKTKSSIRKIEIPKFLYDEIQAYISKLYDVKPTDNFLFIPKNTIATLLDRNAKRVGLPHVSPHILRHSYASFLLNVCKNPTIVAKQLGHADASVTLEFYSHMLPNSDREAVDALEQSLQKK